MLRQELKFVQELSSLADQMMEQSVRSTVLALQPPHRVRPDLGPPPPGHGLEDSVDNSVPEEPFPEIAAAARDLEQRLLAQLFPSVEIPAPVHVTLDSAAVFAGPEDLSATELDTARSQTLMQAAPALHHGDGAGSVNAAGRRGGRSLAVSAATLAVRESLQQEDPALLAERARLHRSRVSTGTSRQRLMRALVDKPATAVQQAVATAASSATAQSRYRLAPMPPPPSRVGPPPAPPSPPPPALRRPATAAAAAAAAAGDDQPWIHTARSALSVRPTAAAAAAGEPGAASLARAVRLSERRDMMVHRVTVEHNLLHRVRSTARKAHVQGRT